MKVNDKVFIVQEGTLYGKNIKQCSTVLAGTIDFITSNEVTIKVTTKENETLLLVMQLDKVLQTPQQVLEAIQETVFNIRPVAEVIGEEETNQVKQD